MIISKPKNTTLFSLFLFLLLCYGAGILSIFFIPKAPAFWYLIPIFCISTALVVSTKVLIGYRTLKIKGEHWSVKKLLGHNFEFDTRDIVWWKVTEIKTAGGLYKELLVHCTAGEVKVSLQEHTDYLKIHKKVLQKCPRKEIMESN